jgi:hypothetical protein
MTDLTLAPNCSPELDRLVVDRSGRNRFNNFDGLAPFELLRSRRSGFRTWLDG